MRWVFPFFLILLFPLSSLSSGVEECEGCVSGAPLDQDKFKMIETIDLVLERDLLRSCSDAETCMMVGWANEIFKAHPHCSRFFINNKGKIGDLGKYLVERISDDILKERESSVFMQNYPDLVKSCPGFPKMTPFQKVGFWTYFFELLAFFETTCDPNKTNSASDVPNGPAVGLYQLELPVKLRAWRGPACKVSERQILTPAGNTACAIDVMKRLVKNSGRVFGVRKASGRLQPMSYWHALNPPAARHAKNENEIHNRMRRYLPRFPLCVPWKID